MSALKKYFAILKRPVPSSRYWILQRFFYLLAFVFYCERQWNFQFYYSPALAAEFHSDILQPMFESFPYEKVYDYLRILHLFFLAVLFAAIWNKKSLMTNLLLYGLNFFFLMLNYAQGYAADIYIQLGLFFFIFCSPSKKILDADVYAQFSLGLLRLYLGTNYLLSSLHKIADYIQTGHTFLSNFSLIQDRNQVASIFIIGQGLSESLYGPLFFLILSVQIFGGLCLFFRQTAGLGIAILISFHLISIPLLNLVLFPLVAITLLLLSGISNGSSALEVGKQFWFAPQDLQVTLEAGASE